MTELDNDLPLPSKKLSYSFQVESEIYHKLDKHIKFLKAVDNNSQSKQRWIIEAFKKKLVKNIQKAKDEKELIYLSVKIDTNLKQEIEKKVKGSHFYKNTKQWMIDAIKERLEEEKIQKD